MVPCQPRQLVIFSLPFAALVAFFWFKRRRSLSRSDPGGTLDLTKPVDNPNKSGVTDTAALKVDDSCVKNIKVACSPSSELEEFAVKNIKTVACSPSEVQRVVESILTPVKEVEDQIIIGTLGGNTPIQNIVDLPKEKVVEERKTEKEEFVKSIPEVKKEKDICSGAEYHFEDKPEVVSKQVENILTTPDFELSEIFHSTVIEYEDSNKPELNSSLTEDKVIAELGSPEKNQCDAYEEHNTLYDITLTEDNSCVKKEDLHTNLTETSEIPLEELTILENIVSEKFQTEKQLENPEFPDKTSEKLLTPVKTIGQSEFNVKEASDSDSVERLENLSTDTGLGSQDLSAGEDFQTEMAQDHSTEKTESNASGLEQKLASLGLDTQQAAAAQRAERDSANHSPAEVMLNSPAISTFSDAHSEGSSDSGKGCSDVVTPPSRTPAGGSSVAGDQVPSIYEFVLPQVIVGRLIGRHGVFLHDIRAKTHTNVFIKRHPETNSLKICAIEGTQPDIDAALKMIRQKFPLRRFPELTLERVSFVKSSCLPISPENLQLHLVEGVNNDVVVSYMVTAGHLFLQLPMHMSYHSLYRMACIMNTVYNTEESPPLPDPQPDVVCVAPAVGGWYRAQILSVDEEAHKSDVRFLDYGGFLTVENSLLRQIRGDFMLLPFQAVECYLANVVPAGGEEEWSEAANQFVQSITTQQILQAQVYDYTDTGLPLVYLYFTQFYQSPTDPGGLESRVVLLNQELVSHGFADLIEDVTQDEGQTTVTESS